MIRKIKDSLLAIYKNRQIKLEQKNEERLVIDHLALSSFTPLTSNEKKSIIKLWGVISKNISFKEYEVFKTIRGFDPRYLSHSLYLPLISRRLNNYYYTTFFENKSLLGFLSSCSVMGFPRCYIRSINGELYSNTMQQLDKKEAIARIREAADMGYTFFDTAEVYVGQYADGTPAINEELVGEALKPIRDKVVIATKGGITLDAQHHTTSDASPASLRRSLEQSLRRLQTDTIDLYYQHRLDTAREPEEVAYTMQTFIKEGKIRHWGLSNASPDYIRRAHAVCPITAVQERYSLMYRRTARLFPLLEELRIGFVAYSPLANGFLSGLYKGTEKFDKELDFRSWMPQYTEEGAQKAKDLTDLLAALSVEKGATPAQISLAWMLCKKPYIVPIPGTTKQERLRENAEAADITLSAEDVKKIDQILDHSEFSIFAPQTES